MIERTVEDRLREEYFELLPDIRRVAEHLEANIRHCVLPVSRSVSEYSKNASFERNILWSNPI